MRYLRVNSINILFAFFINILPFLGIKSLDSFGILYLLINLVFTVYAIISSKKIKIELELGLIFLGLFNLCVVGLTGRIGLGNISLYSYFILTYLNYISIKWNSNGIKLYSNLIILSSIFIMIFNINKFNPNGASQLILVFIIFYLINIMSYKKNRIIKLIKYIFICIYFVTIFKLESRMAIVSLIYMIILLVTPVAIITNKVIYRMIYSTTLIQTIVLPCIYVYMYTSGKFNDLIFSNSSFFTGRELIWIEVFDKLKKDLLLGVGSKVSLQSFGEVNIHNSILTIMFSSGLIFTIIYIVLIIVILEKSRKTIMRDDVSRICYIGFLAIIVNSSFENILIYLPTIWFSQILISIIKYRSNNSKFIIVNEEISV